MCLSQEDGPTSCQDDSSHGSDLSEERWEFLRQLNGLLEAPMIGLSFVWLGLTVIDLTAGLGRTLEVVSYVIWGLFGLHFLLGVAIAPGRLAYLRHNWLTALALILPAFRILRVFRAFRLLRAARAARSLSLVRLLTSINRGMRAIGSTFGRRGVGYVAALTLIVTVAGAAGMAQFESPAALRESGYLEVAEAGGGLGSYGEGLWWTAMIMTTMGSEYWPKTVEGRILGWLLALYAFAVFGYITATIASFFIGQDSQGTTVNAETTALRSDIAALRSQVAVLTELLAERPANIAGTSRPEPREQPLGSLQDHQGRDDGQSQPEERQFALGPGA